MSTWKRRANGAALVVSGLLAVGGATGCDKLEALAGGKGGDADASTSAASTSGGGLLSFLGSDFEGEITMSVKSRDKGVPASLLFAIKKPRVRLETGAIAGGGPGGMGNATLLVHPTEKKAWALVPSQKKAMLFDLDKMKDMPPGMLPSGLPARRDKGKASAPPKIDKTGKKDTVAGYGCDVWLITQPDGRKAEVCAAEGITWIDVSDLGFSSPEMTAAAALTDANRFPLRIVSTDPSGAEDVRMEATKVEKKKLDDASFVVPPDYQVMDVAALMGSIPKIPGLGAPVPAAPPAKTR